MRKSKLPKHGRITVYIQGCRCKRCKKAWSTYAYALRQKKASLGVCSDCASPAEANRSRCTKHREMHVKRMRRVRGQV